MIATSWTPALWQTFGESCTDEARALLCWDRPPLETIALLQKRWLHYDALLLVGRLLPPREAVWWGCLCCWDVLAGRLGEAEERALESVVRWVVEPSEANRRAAETAGAQAGIRTPAGALAHAVFFSEGSIVHPDFPAVPAPGDAGTTSVCGAVLLAAVVHEPMRFNQRYRRFISIALEIVHGRHRWAPEAAASQPAAEAVRQELVLTWHS